ncbi:hypothetical protein C2G38_2076812 [Gigaspora rosea]|uniref:Uncharacterized protein n=1 Tax=Gigaspora rosea TaxID=44941 RepID=A0A397VJF8_9GLOM|nr:hypothetical protein C2G38_2076812 [Gigaspora rosea]
MEEIVPYLSSENKKFDHVISLDEITDEFLANIEKIENFRAPFFNNIPIVEKFNLPNNWKIVHKEKKYVWTSPTTKDKI